MRLGQFIVSYTLGIATGIWLNQVSTLISSYIVHSSIAYFAIVDLEL